MQSSPNSSPVSFFWLLSAVFGFTVLFYVLYLTLGRNEERDPRAPVRYATKEEVMQGQTELLQKMGLTDESTRAEWFAKVSQKLSATKVGKSDVAVPGSPTQLKMMEQGAPPPPADSLPN